MAVLRAKEVTKMTDKDRKEKLKDLRMELIRANVTANRTNAKTKEIKKAISRLLTFNKASKNPLLNKK
jgi:ribosomal protein L29